MNGDLDHHASFNPDEPLEEFLARIPGAWAVCLLADENGRPILLLCVKNLRACLKRRLGPEAAEQAASPTRRIDLSAVARQVSWTRVDSRFEQDLAYLQAARHWFPDSYVGFRPASWIHVDPEADRPRFTRTVEPGAAAGQYFGPIPDRSSADKFVHAIEDLFDLCRDPAALAAAPANPCQWKQMGKCVGPCDGTVSLPAYRALVAHAAVVLSDIPQAIEAHELRMRHAAAALNFEAAGRIKIFLEKLGALRRGPNRHLRSIEQFRFLAVMPGRAHPSAKLFAITPGQVSPMLCLSQKPDDAIDEVLGHALEVISGPAEAIHTPAQRERLSLVTHHLFPARKARGVFIPLEELGSKALTDALAEVNRKRGFIDAPDEEGEVRGLQAP